MSIGSKANRVVLDQDDLEDQFDRQLRLIRQACERFDAGNQEEAINIVTRIRVLVNDHQSSSISLLKQLGLKDRMRFIDTGVYGDLLARANEEWIKRFEFANGAQVHDSGNPAGEGLVEPGQVGNGPIGWFAPLRINRFSMGEPSYKATKRSTLFDEWWDTPFVRSSSGKLFSRAHLIKIMANQDGATHVDPALDADYRDLNYDDLGLGIEIVHHTGTHVDDFLTRDSFPAMLNNVAFASVRQIAFELDMSIQFSLAGRKATMGPLLSTPEYEGVVIPRAPHRHIHYQPMVTLAVPSDKFESLK